MNVLIIKVIYYILNLLMSLNNFSRADNSINLNDENEKDASVVTSDFIKERDSLKQNSISVFSNYAAFKS